MKRIPVLLFFLAIALFVDAQVIPLDTAVRTGKLANGLTYYIRHNEEPKDRVVFYLVNKVGSVLENDDQRGLAHFMEHMSFNGTTHFPKNELINYLQKSGVRFGADINAYTSFDETVYQLPLPSDSPQVVLQGIEIMHDWAGGATLDAAEIDKERGVVLEEKRLGKGASDRMSNKYFPVILNGSRYASRLPIGDERTLQEFKPETIRSFYHDWYRPNLQALIVVGDVDVKEMEKIIRSKFADLKNPVNARPRPAYTVKLTGRNQFLAVTDPEMAYTSAQVIIKQPELPLRTKEDYRSGIVRSLYNDMIAGRYAELLRQANPPFLSGGSSVGDFLGGLDAYTISVTAKPGELESGFKSAWRENERVRRFGFTATELARAKASYLSQFESYVQEKTKTPSDNYVNEYLQHFLHGSASPGIDYEYALVKAKLPGITLNEINALAKKIIKTTDRDILLMAPEKDKAGLPSAVQVETWIREVAQEKVTAFVDETNTGQLLSSPPVAGTITDRSYDATLGVTTLKLSNGIRVLLKKTNFKNDEVVFNAFSPGGTSLYSDEEFQSASAANIITSFGAGNYSSTALDKYLSAKQLGVQLYIGERTQNISGGAVVKDLGAALELMYAYITEPRKDSILFQGIMTRSRAGLANRLDDPNNVFQDTMSAVLGNYNIRRTGPSIAKLDMVNQDRAFSIFKERFGNAGEFTFVFVGSIDSVSLEPMIEKYIASLPVTSEKVQARDLGINVPAGVIERIVKKGSEPKASVNLVYSGSFEYTPEDKIRMEALKEVLQIRLTERLREDEGGVYSPGIRIATSKLPQGRFRATVSFGCSPENVEKLIASAVDEIEKIKTDGPSQLNIDKFKAETKRSTEVSLKTNDFWVNYISDQLQNGEGVDGIVEYTNKINAVTPADVQQVAVKYLTGKNVIRFVLLPSK